MRIVKFIAGLGCLVLALNLGLFVLSGLVYWPFPICAVGFAVTGWLLILKRQSPMSRKARTSFIFAICFLGGITFAMVIPIVVKGCHQSSANACINSLRVLTGAKEEWALETGKTNGVLATVDDLKPYVKLDAQRNLPHCSLGGTYIIGRVGEDVKCSIGDSAWPNNHVLPGGEDDSPWKEWWRDFKNSYGLLFGISSHPKAVTPVRLLFPGRDSLLT